MPWFKSSNPHFVFLKSVTVLYILLAIFSVQAASPYPASQVAQNILWDFSHVVQLAPGSDLWPVTWADDGHLYTGWGDGGGFGGTNSDGRVQLGIARIVGGPSNLVEACGSGQKNCINVYGGACTENPANDGIDSYITGLICVEGKLYAWRNQTGEGPWQLAWSNDHGANWSKVGWGVEETKFGEVTFLNFGKNNAGARDGYVYSYGYNRGGGNNQLYLARVPKTAILTQTSYEYFAGLDAGNNPTWKTGIDNRKPVFEDPNGITGVPSVAYNAGLQRYLLTLPHGGWDGSLKRLGVFDAPEPWGPWTTVQYTDTWGNSISGNALGYYIPTKTGWMSPDGKTIHVIFSASGQDRFNLVKGTIQLVGPTDNTPPTAPTSLIASVYSQSQINLSWNAAIDNESGISGYKVYRKMSAAAVFTEVASLGKVTSYSDKGLNAGTTYDYQVSAVNGAGLEGPKSNQAQATTKEPVPHFTSSDQATAVAGQPFGYKVTYDAAGQGTVTLTYLKKPAWVGQPLGDSLWGTAPQDAAGTLDTIQVEMEAGIYKDTLTVVISIQAPSQHLVISNTQPTTYVWDQLENGKPVYVDRQFQHTVIPFQYQALDYLQTANEDKASTGSSFIMFDVSQDVVVYVGHDDRIQTKPSWLALFVDTGDDLVISGSSYSLWAKDFTAGTVVLGGNEGTSSTSMYVVVVKAKFQVGVSGEFRTQERQVPIPAAADPMLGQAVYDILGRKAYERRFVSYLKIRNYVCIVIHSNATKNPAKRTLQIR